MKAHHSKNQAIKAFEKFPVSQHKAWKDDWNMESYSKVLTEANFEEEMQK